MTKRSRIDWAKLADEMKANDRPHAGHFSWETDRAVAEQGVLWEFENYLKQQGVFLKCASSGVEQRPA